MTEASSVIITKKERTRSTAVRSKVRECSRVQEEERFKVLRYASQVVSARLSSPTYEPNPTSTARTHNPPFRASECCNLGIARCNRYAYQTAFGHSEALSCTSAPDIKQSDHMIQIVRILFVG